MPTKTTILGVAIVGLAILGGVFRHKLIRLYNVNSLFDADKITHNFRNMETLGFPHRVVGTRDVPVAILESITTPLSLPASFPWNGTSLDLNNWLEENWTTGLVVMKVDSPTKARVLYEKYSLGNTANSRCVSWSMCKSVISAMMGVAVDKGYIQDVNTQTVTDFVPELVGTGYDGVLLKDVLQMSSGVAFDEDYFNPFSDINMMGYSLALGWSMDSFVATLKRERTPGTYNHYVSIDTQVLGMVLARATKQSLTSFLEEHIWSKVGFEQTALWLQDNDVDQMELAFGILGVSTRDYARFGWLYLNGGLSPSSGERVLSKEWIQASLQTTLPHLQPGTPASLSDYPTFGYGYQWWLCPSEEDPSKASNAFMAIGVYGQAIFVSPDDGIVIAKNAAYPNYEEMQDPASHENFVETMALPAFREIARVFRDK